MSLNTVKGSAQPLQKKVRWIEEIDEDKERQEIALPIPQDDLVWIQRACKLNFPETLYADLIKQVKKSKVAFNFIGAELFRRRGDTVYFGNSFRDVTEILRNHGHKMIYHDFERFLDNQMSGWNLPSAFERDFSIVVDSQGTCARMPKQPVHFAVPTIDMAKRSPLERGVSCAHLHLPEYYHIVIIRDPKDDGSAIVSSDANAIQKLVPTYYISQAEHTPVSKQVILLLLYCALELKLSTEEREILNNLVKRNISQAKTWVQKKKRALG